MTTRPYTILETVPVRDVADARKSLARECRSAFIENAAGQSFEIHVQHGSGRTFALVSRFASKRGAALAYDLHEITVAPGVTTRLAIA